MEEEFRRQRASSKLSAAASATSDFDMAPSPPPQRAPVPIRASYTRAPVPSIYQNRTIIPATSPNRAASPNSGSDNHGFETDERVVSRL